MIYSTVTGLSCVAAKREPRNAVSRRLWLIISTVVVLVGVLLGGVSAPAQAAPTNLWTNADELSPSTLPGAPNFLRMVDLGGGQVMAIFQQNEGGGVRSLRYSTRSASGVWSASAYVGSSADWTVNNRLTSEIYDAVKLTDGSVLVVAMPADSNFQNLTMKWIRFNNGSWGTLGTVDGATGNDWGQCRGRCLVALPQGKAMLAMSNNASPFRMTYTMFDGAGNGGLGAWGTRVTSPYVTNVGTPNYNALALASDGHVYITYQAFTGAQKGPFVTRVNPSTLMDDTAVQLSTSSSSVNDSNIASMAIPPGTSNPMIVWKEGAGGFQQVWVSQFDSTQSFASGWSTKSQLAAGSGIVTQAPALAALADGRMVVAAARGSSVQAMVTTGPATAAGPWPSSWTVLGDVTAEVAQGSVADPISLAADGADVVGAVAADPGGQGPGALLGIGFNGSTSEWSGLVPLATSASEWFNGSPQNVLGLAVAPTSGAPVTAWTSKSTGDNAAFGLTQTVRVVPTGPAPPPAPVAPTAPRDVAGMPGDRSAIVSWREPEGSGSFPVSNYKVTSTPGGKLCLTTSLSCTVAGLTNGVAYTFTVEALNGAGWGPAGGPSAPVIPGGLTPAPAPQPLPTPVEPGESVLQVNGVVDPNVTVQPKSSDKGLDITGDGWNMELDGLGPDGKPLNLGPDGTLRLANERDVQTEGTGFLPNSEVDLYVDPPVLLTGASTRSARSAKAIYVGTVKTDSRGNFAGTATLPESITPGDHVLQAVGYSPQRQSRALSLGVIVDPWIVLDQGTRKADGRHDRIRTSGSSGGIDAGVKLTPYIRYSGQQSFSQGKATITVQSDGTFTWTRQIKKSKGLTGYVAWKDTESNRVFWAKIS